MGKPAQEAVAQTLKIRIAEPLRAKAGANRVRIVIEDASGRPLDGAEVEISVFMPQMGNMAPMSSKAALQNSGSGEYSGSLEIPMASTWQTTVTVRKGGPVLGSMQTSVIAQ
jgi:FixH.